ncbi:MAG: hypothetical protein QMC59_05020 [Candidatus Poseidoniaceae archaeon]|tara:strand:- start:10884 stop:13199 length:2316 start_codon:yes stop_codon:yes gene_type:complete
MRKRLAAMALLALLVCVTLGGYASAADDPVYEPGFIEWEIDEMERLFVEGLDAEEAVLQRGRTDNAVGGFSVNSNAGPVPVFTISSPPVLTPINATVNMSVFFSAYIETGPLSHDSCTRQPANVGDRTTTLTYSVDAGGVPVYDASVTQTIDTAISNAAMNFSGESQEAFISMQIGDVFTLSLTAENNCQGTVIRVQWGAFEQNSGGIIIEGKLYEPTASIKVDDERRAHVEVQPLFPWGVDDVKTIKWELWGPLRSDEKQVKSPEYMMEDSTGRNRIDRPMAGNQTSWAWSGTEQLGIGDANLQVCIQTIGGDLNSDCHAFGIVRFEVQPADKGFASAAIFLSLTTFGALIGYLVTLVRNDNLPPLPILGALVLLAIFVIPTAWGQANLGSDASIGENARAYDGELYDEMLNPVYISDYLDGNKAIVVAVTLPGSENAFQQALELNKTLDTRADEIAVIQVIAGMEANQADVQSLINNLNVSWPILLDSDGYFANSLPTGVADAVLVIDPSMRVTHAEGPYAPREHIDNAIDSVSVGGGQSFTQYFGLLFGPGLFLLFMALPREGWVEPETPLPPGTLWASIAVAGGVGVLLVNLPALLATLAPIDSTMLFWIDIAMLLWMIEMCVVTAKKGAPIEAQVAGKFLHRVFPKAFRDWRELEDMQRDVLLGVWLGWFGWLSFPALFPQGVGATMLSGALGLGFGLFYMIWIALFAGIVVLFIRFIASWGGSISRVFGEFGAEVFAQFIGWCLLPIAIWVTIDATMTAMDLGLF